MTKKIRPAQLYAVSSTFKDKFNQQRKFEGSSPVKFYSLQNFSGALQRKSFRSPK